MIKTNFYEGDGIYYYQRNDDGTFDTIPATVIRVMPKMLLIRGDFREDKLQTRRVLKTNCDKQIYYTEL